MLHVTVRTYYPLSLPLSPSLPPPFLLSPCPSPLLSFPLSPSLPAPLSLSPYSLSLNHTLLFLSGCPLQLTKEISRLLRLGRQRHHLRLLQESLLHVCPVRWEFVETKVY